MSPSTGFPSEKPLSTLHRPSESLWILELHNGVDNRLTEELITKSLVPALNLVEKEWRLRRRSEMLDKKKDAGKGALIISGAHNQEKFFSNGLDYNNAIKTPYFFSDILYPFISRVLSFPIPTIAAINGHSFAAGWFLSLACDYRVMIDGAKRRVWACMNEVHFGAPYPRAFAVLLKTKCSSPKVLRRFTLEGARFTPQELLETEMVDDLADSTKTVLSKTKELAEKHAVNACTGVWGQIKREIYHEVFESFTFDKRTVFPDEEDKLALAKL